MFGVGVEGRRYMVSMGRPEPVTVCVCVCHPEPVGCEKRGGVEAQELLTSPGREGMTHLELMERQSWTSGATAEPCSRVGICSV